MNPRREESILVGDKVVGKGLVLAGRGLKYLEELRRPSYPVGTEKRQINPVNFKCAFYSLQLKMFLRDTVLRR
jgi:hypothetical protein